MEKILLDTDIGTDIDDAVCLAYLLSHPECELLGITTVSGQSKKRAMLASVICEVAGKDIPIYPGTEKPLLTKQRQDDAAQSGVLPKWKHKKEFPEYTAIDFMRKTIRENPGEITLLAIGPLTNIALLFCVDPEIPKLLKSLVLMCGCFTDRAGDICRVEWNALCDPYAAAIVYNARVQKHRSIGLDVTSRVFMDKDDVHQKFTSKILKPVLDFAGAWFQTSKNIVFHDVLAAASIFVDGREIQGNIIPVTEPGNIHEIVVLM